MSSVIKSIENETHHYLTQRRLFSVIVIWTLLLLLQCNQSKIKHSDATYKEMLNICDEHFQNQENVQCQELK